MSTQLSDKGGTGDETGWRYRIAIATEHEAEKYTWKVQELMNELYIGILPQTSLVARYDRKIKEELTTEEIINYATV